MNKNVEKEIMTWQNIHPIEDKNYKTLLGWMNLTKKNKARNLT